jgi:hypothetical protein
MTPVHWIVIGLGAIAAVHTVRILTATWELQRAVREKAERHASCLRDIEELRRHRPEVFDQD